MDKARSLGYASEEELFRISVISVLLKYLHKWTEGNADLPTDWWRMGCELLTQWSGLIWPDVERVHTILSHVKEAIGLMKHRVRDQENILLSNLGIFLIEATRRFTTKELDVLQALTILDQSFAPERVRRIIETRGWPIPIDPHFSIAKGSSQAVIWGTLLKSSKKLFRAWAREVTEAPLNVKEKGVELLKHLDAGLARIGEGWFSGLVSIRAGVLEEAWRSVFTCHEESILPQFTSMVLARIALQLQELDYKAIVKKVYAKDASPAYAIQYKGPELRSWITRDFVLEGGLPNGLLLKTIVLGAVQVYCSEHTQAIAEAIKRFKEFFSGPEILDQEPFWKQFERWAREIKGPLVNNQRPEQVVAFLRSFIGMGLGRSNLLEEMRIVQKCFERQKEIAAQSNTLGAQIQSLVEQHLVGFTGVARARGRCFDESLSIEAIRLVIASVRAALAIRPGEVYLMQLMKRGSWTSLADVCLVGDDVNKPTPAGREAWVKGWSAFVIPAAFRPAEEVGALQLYALLIHLWGIPGFWFHSDWQWNQEKVQSPNYDLLVGCLDLTGRIGWTPEYRRAVLDASVGIPPLFTLLTTPDHPYAELIRNGLEGMPGTTLMPSLHNTIPPNVTNYRPIAEEVFDRVLEAHMVQWKFLAETRLFRVFPLVLVECLYQDLAVWLMAPCFATDAEVIESKPLEMQYADMVEKLTVRIQAAMHGIWPATNDSRDRIADAVPIARLLMIGRGLPRQWSQQPVELVDAFNELTTNPESVFFDHQQQGDSRDEISWPQPAGRVVLEALGVEVYEFPGGWDFPTEVREVVEEYKGKIGKSIAWKNHESEKKVYYFMEPLFFALGSRLQYLYVRFGMNVVSKAAWCRFLDGIARELLLGSERIPAEVRKILLSQGEEAMLMPMRVFLSAPQFHEYCLGKLVSIERSRFVRDSDDIKNGTMVISPYGVIEESVGFLRKMNKFVINQIGGSTITASQLLTAAKQMPSFLERWKETVAEYLEQDTHQSDPFVYWIKRLDRLVSGGFNSLGEYPMNPQFDLTFTILNTDSKTMVQEIPETLKFVKAETPEQNLPQPIRKDGFFALEEDIQNVSRGVFEVVKPIVSAFASQSTKVSASLLADTAEQLRTTLAGLPLKVTDHSGFVASLRREILLVLGDEFDDDTLVKIAQPLSLFLGAAAIEKEKTRKKTAASALEKLSEWVDRLSESGPLAEVRAKTGTSMQQDLSGTQTEQSRPSPALGRQSEEKEVGLAKEQFGICVDASGLRGKEDAVEACNAAVKAQLGERFAKLAASLMEKGVLSVAVLDELREAVMLEVVDCGAQVADFERWREFLMQSVAEVGGGLFRSSLEWASPFVGLILASETGKDAKCMNAKRMLTEDKRSPFCKQAGSKQVDGNFKFTFDFSEDVQWHGFSINDGRIESFKQRVSRAGERLRAALDEHADQLPKPLRLVEDFADDFECCRFEEDAVVMAVDEVRAFVETQLTNLDLSAWHADIIARFVVSQYLDGDVQAKEKAAVKSVLLSDRQSDFSEDPFAHWRPLVPDAPLQVPHLPRIRYPGVGFSLQAECDDSEFLFVLQTVTVQHLQRWSRRPLPLPWSAVEALMRDLRAESLKRLLYVDEVAVMTIVFEERCLTHLANMPLCSSVLRSLVAEYVVESLQPRPCQQAVAELKRRVLEHEKFFSAKERTAPAPVCVDVGFSVCGTPASVEVQDRFQEALERGLLELLQRGMSQRGFTELLHETFKQYQATMTDRVRFKAFLLPMLSLVLKNRGVDGLWSAEGLVEAALPECQVIRLVEELQGFQVPDVFDGSRPEVYLIWRAQFLERISLPMVGTAAATELLMKHAPVAEVAEFASVFEGSNSAKFLCILSLLNEKFDSPEAREHVLECLRRSSIGEAERARLEFLKRNLIDGALSPERKKMAEFVEKIDDNFKKILAFAVLSFGDERFPVFKARVAAFLRSD